MIQNITAGIFFLEMEWSQKERFETFNSDTAIAKQKKDVNWVDAITLINSLRLFSIYYAFTHFKHQVF